MNKDRYYEGKGCRCFARSEGECSCQDVDWTPREVYELRKRITELERLNNMSKRKELNTDILLHIAAQGAIANTLLLQGTKMEQAERSLCEESLSTFTDILTSLVDRSKVLDK